MNNKKLSSVEDLIAVMKETDLGSLLSFEVPQKSQTLLGIQVCSKKTQEKAKVADKDAQNNSRLTNTLADMNILPSKKIKLLPFVACLT